MSFEVRPTRRETLDGLMGQMDASQIRPRPGAIDVSIVESLRAVEGGLTELVSDALDEFGIRGAVGASTLSPVIFGARVVGPALTFRQIASRLAPDVGARARNSSSAMHEVHYQARAGDVLVIQGVPGASSLGGIMARVGRSHGEIGAVVDGGIRNVAIMRRDGFPVWAREITPITGKWRLDAVEVNGTVVIAGVSVASGDLVVADDSGVCFVPGSHIRQVFEWVSTKAAFERSVFASIGRSEETGAR